jgi:hypothetical protein
MSEAWLNFIIVVFLQFLFFIIHAWYVKKFSDVPRTLGWGILIGIGVGLFSDLVLGKFFGLWSYTLGFGALPLILSATFVYGLLAANTLLMQRSQLSHFFVWTIIATAVYEISNHFFHVWTYKFVFPPTIFLLIGYFGTVIVIATISHIFLGRRFFFIDNLLKK